VVLCGPLRSFVVLCGPVWSFALFSHTAFFARLPGESTILFCYYLLRGDTAAPSGLYARLCHAFLVLDFIVSFCIEFASPYEITNAHDNGLVYLSFRF